jgi:hypothetical protein
MKSTGRKTVKGANVSAPLSAKATVTKAAATKAAATSKGQPTYDAIAKRAFELYLERGSVEGHHEEDWLLAEAELSRAG